MSDGVRFLAAVVLGFLPGAWLGFTVPDQSIPWRVKSALSVALSPAVLAVEIAFFSVVGQPFSHAVYVAVLLNLFALGVIARDMRRIAPRSADAVAPTALLAPLWCFGLLILILLTMWLGIPNLRVYSWHNMMQMDACYQIVNLPAIPQDWDLAGVRLNYGWLGLIQLTAISWMVDCPPTLVFPWLSGLQLLALVILMYETARQFDTPSPILTASALAIILLGTNTLGTLNVLAQGPWFLRGEMRTGPFIAKYSGIDAMDIGLSLVAAIVYVIAVSTRRTVARAGLLVPLLILAIGISYPLLVPSAVLVSGLWWLCLTGRIGLACPEYSKGTLWLVMVATGLALAATLFYLRFLSGGRPMHAIRFASAGEIRTNARVAVPCMAVMFALAYPPFRNAWRRGDTPILLLGAGALLTTLLFLFTWMPSRVQYKHLFTSAICLAPLVSMQLCAWFARSGRKSIAWAAATALIMELLAGTCLWFYHRPPELPLGIPVDESSFYVRAGGGADRGWLEALRSGTPRDTLLVLPDSPLPVSTLTQRASLVAAQPPDINRVGQGQGAELALVYIKGYPLSMFRERTRLRQECFSERADFARLTADLQAFHHPVAIVFEKPHTRYCTWLRSHSLGMSIAQDTNRIIWLLPTGGAGSGRNGAAVSG